jgi:hypothetical protein
MTSSSGVGTCCRIHSQSTVISGDTPATFPVCMTVGDQYSALRSLSI